ncbi:unnamed protein product, partial [Brachionus calyciflorus]
MSDRMLNPKLNRNLSMHPSHGSSMNHENQDDSASPLRLFSRARQSMNLIYTEFNSIINEINSFLDSNDMKSSNLIDNKEIQNLKTYKEKCDGLMKMITRDRMKCVFFGRTSNGKSTVVNSMLHQKILPTGIGHTTNCFLQVEG